MEEFLMEEFLMEEFLMEEDPMEVHLLAFLLSGLCHFLELHLEALPTAIMGTQEYGTRLQVPGEQYLWYQVVIYPDGTAQEKII